MITPNIDRLGRWPVLNRASANRLFVVRHGTTLSGRHPQRTQAWNFQNDFRQAQVGRTGSHFLSGSDARLLALGSGKTFAGIPLKSTSWSNYGVMRPVHTPHTWNVSKVSSSRPATDVSNRSYVFSTNGYPQCNQQPGT